MNTLIQNLVRIDSVNPALDPAHPGETEIARFVADWAVAHGLKVDWLESTPGRPSVVVTAPGSGGGRNLLLNAHLDTVGVIDMATPFEPEIRDGRMYGRGVMDMKASLAACMLAVAHASSLGLSGDVILTAVADEEHGSVGTQEALAVVTAATRIDAAIVTEPSDLDLHVAHRGFALFEVEFEGKASHTSQPEKGVNALSHLSRLLGSVERQDRALQQRSPHPLLAHGSLQPVLAAGGHELFTTPRSAGVTLERRTLPGETAAAAQAELQALLDELAREDPTVKAKMRAQIAREPFEAAADSEIVRFLCAAVAAERGDAPELLGAPYWTDAALVAEAGIPTVLFGPVGGGIHQPSEWLDVDSAHVVLRVLERVIGSFAVP
ncbi:MAG TPA: M20/M25/M40 family metallo-hydrolase [Trueperaceae bacterium]|nr:M20/M25/M40 family metallo-hydrolase [Trueperaceae bacterium]